LCIKDDCSAGTKHLKPDGTCAADAAACGTYFRAETIDTVRKCVQDKCTGDQFQTLDGKCVAKGADCPQGSRQDDTAMNNAKKCYRDDCAASNKYWDLTGKCVDNCSTVK
jgi:hypothetical protein